MITSCVMYSYTLHISSLEILNPEAAVAHAELTLDGRSCLVRPEVSKRSDSKEGGEGTLLLMLVT
jgi:hypothetical protein